MTMNEKNKHRCVEPGLASRVADTGKYAKAQALANEREAGRQEGLEQAAKWLEADSRLLGPPVSIACAVQAKAIRELPPTTKTNGD